MIPETGQHVKCLLRNNSIAEGIVVEWFNNYAKLRSLDGESILIIHHPDQDIILTKIVLENQPKSFAEAMKKREQKKVLEEIVKDSQKENVSNPFDSDHNKSLAELHLELAKQEREIIAKKLKNHHIDGTKKVEYGYPGFFKKPRSK